MDSQNFDEQNFDELTVAFIENTLRGKVRRENFDELIASCQTFPPSKFCAIRYNFDSACGIKIN